MRRSPVLLVIVLLAVCAGAYGSWKLWQRAQRRAVRAAMLEELAPVSLKNCTLKRYGGPNDGGYLMCENLIEVQSAYSYGISTEDTWGCQVANQFEIPIHQYDCFTEHRPACDGATFVFHDECVGPRTDTIEGRLFDSVTNQLAKNGDTDKRILLKIDVEGAEWDSLMELSAEALARIDQMPMEMHGNDEQRFLDLVRRLKETFYPVNLNFNNYSCDRERYEPMPAWAYQVLWVNKRLGIVDTAVTPPAPRHPLNAPDGPALPDCRPSS
jgi:hypothetical protein